MTQTFTNALDVIEQLQPDEPVYCFRRHIVAATAKEFVTQFNGRTLYAVKCNPHPEVLRALYENGVCGFDVASLNEIKLVKELFPDSHCAFMHPVKSRPAIRAAYDQFGIRHFVVDSLTELEKIEQETNGATDLTIFVRFKTEAAKEVEYDLSDKFGADVKTTLELIARVTPYHRLGLAFHIGSQCINPQGYVNAIELLKTIIERSGVNPAIVDIGGGFPTYYRGLDIPPLKQYLQSINHSLKALQPYSFEVLAEPGRALANEALSLLVQVQLRKGDCLYINDGLYGALSELPHLRKGTYVPAQLLRTSSDNTPLQWFHLYGATCDSTDVIKNALELPADIREGDWIEIGLCGAYTLCLATQFNGFISQRVVEVTDMPFYYSR